LKAVQGAMVDGASKEKDMAKSEDPAGRIRIVQRGNGGCLRGAVITVLVVAVIGLTTIFFAVRTEAGREFCQERLSRAVGMDLTVQRARIGWPYALVLEDVGPAEPGPAPGPAFRAAEIRLSPGIRPLCRISVHRGALDLMLDEQGRWQPAFLAGLGGVPEHGISEIAGMARSLRRGTALRVREGLVRWLDAGGTEQAAAERVDLEIVPVRLPGRRMIYYRLSVLGLTGTAGWDARNLEREWLSSDRRDYIEIAGEAEGRAGAEPDADAPGGDDDAAGRVGDGSRDGD